MTIETLLEKSPIRISRPLLRALASLALLIAALIGSTTAYAVVVRTAVAYRPAPVYRPVARTAAVVGTAAVTAAAVGTVVHTLPPQCSAVVVGNVAYQRCGSTWYRPAYAGSAVSYTVVAPPR
jgi:hypothetical protein